jgi:hypothetical protein
MLRGMEVAKIHMDSDVAADDLAGSLERNLGIDYQIVQDVVTQATVRGMREVVDALDRAGYGDSPVEEQAQVLADVVRQQLVTEATVWFLAGCAAGRMDAAASAQMAAPEAGKTGWPQ